MLREQLGEHCQERFNQNRPLGRMTENSEQVAIQVSLPGIANPARTEHSKKNTYQTAFFGMPRMIAAIPPICLPSSLPTKIGANLLFRLFLLEWKQHQLTHYPEI